MARMSKSIELKIAFNPLNDAALIVVAEALGFYESEGLDVTLMREANWSTATSWPMAWPTRHTSLRRCRSPPPWAWVRRSAASLPPWRWAPTATPFWSRRR